ncbi:MAG: GspE/PulE family protein [Phycisphaerales bacterium]
MLDTSDFLEKALLEDGLLEADELREARDLADEVGCSIDEAIATLGFIDGRRIALTKAQICESAFVDLSHFETNFENCQLVPRGVAEQFLVFPLFVINEVVTLGMDDPLNLAALDQMRQILKREVEPVQCETKLLRELIDRAYSLSSHAPVDRDDRDDDPIEADDAGPIVAAVNTLLSDAVEAKASDIHLNPDQNELHVRFRIDGVLQKRQGPPLSMHAKLVQRLKVMANLDLTQTRRPQDGKFRFESRDRRVDVRLSILPTVTGENVVIRLLNTNTAILNFDDLGVPGDVQETIESVLSQPHGMMLVTGPTGSGKTTTLYTAISKLNTPDRNIITIEDPVEIRLSLVRQVQVNHEVGMSFANALRSILRQDPDVILVGEIRDEETATIALQASLTGHFVLSTVHTNDAAGSITRLRDFGLPPFVINASLLGAMAQRLVRRICSQCAGPAEPSEFILKRFRLDSAEGFLEGRGCAACRHTGFSGRVGIYEMLRLTPSVQRAIAEGGSTEAIREASIAEGMRFMWQDGFEKARLGLTTLDEVAKVASVMQVEQLQEDRRRSA